jgi:hypothetical protein
MNLTGQQPYQKHTRRKKYGKDEMSHPLFQYGTDDEFLEWVSHQPSVINGEFTQRNPDRCIPCHVRRQRNGAGTGHKPPFSAVPMTDEQHQIQTHYGEAECLRRYIAGSWTDESAKQWFDEALERMRERWVIWQTAIR